MKLGLLIDDVLSEEAQDDSEFFCELERDFEFEDSESSSYNARFLFSA